MIVERIESLSENQAGVSWQDNVDMRHWPTNVLQFRCASYLVV